MPRAAKKKTPPVPATTATVRWSGLTHRGRVRPNNEDAFLALAFDEREVRFLGKTGEASLAEADFVFAVSDGMGGAKSGEFASRFALDRITKNFPRHFRRGADAGAVLAQLVADIHHDLLRLGFAYEECAGTNVHPRASSSLNTRTSCAKRSRA